MNVRNSWGEFKRGVFSKMGALTVLVFAAVLAFLVSGTGKVVWDTYVFTTEELPIFRQHMEAFEGMQRSLTRMELRLSSVSGTAICADCCEGDRTRWLQVNRRSAASQFRDGQRVRVTRQTAPYTSLIVTVDGDFDPASGEIVQLNSLACHQLRQSEDETEFRVTVEPAIEE